MKSRIAAVIPARNEENFIGETLAALFEQYTQPDRVIVVNDGSTDNTAEIALSAGAQVVDVPDRGQNVHSTPFLAAVINHGLKALQECGYGSSENDYILILGADHVLVPNYIGTILDVMTADRNIAICSGQISEERSVIPRGSGRVVRAKFWRSIRFRYPENYGFETHLLIKAQQERCKAKVLSILVTETLRKTGRNYDKSVYISYDKSLKALGYSRLYCAEKIGLISLRNPRSGFNILKGYTSSDVQAYDRKPQLYLTTVQHKRIKHYIISTIKALTTGPV